MKLKRRSFIKLAGVTGAGLALSQMGFDVQPIEAASNECRIHSAREYTSICTFCSCGCGMICHVKNGKLINLEGDPDHIVNEGALCSKGAAMSVVPNSDQRVKTPLYRAPGSDRWEEISWDTAIEKVSQKIKQTRDHYWIADETIAGQTYTVNRTDALGFLGGAQNNNEECYLMSKMARLLGATFLEHQARV
ncbi:MAG TPA: molybdopterin-dependent oxidoreductase [Firmicutes bacterium]|nr:molybdopterin-dependent oxidoreductase [Bacillota bacterium]